jgi:ubiquinone/menaquinone biosynthesis C-methylase UbiE
MTTQVGTADEHRRNSHEFWERMAKSWERHRDLGWRSTRDVSEWLVERVDPGPGQTLLDLGAGTGETGFLAAARLGGCRTPDLERLLAADGAGGQQVARELGVGNAEFQVLDAERIELDDASVDGVVCRWSYMLFGDPLQALREARRVLRPRGRLAFST